MERLIMDLIEKMTLRRKLEAAKIEKYHSESDRDLILLATGKVYELDELLGFLSEMVTYYNGTKKIVQ